MLNSISKFIQIPYVTSLLVVVISYFSVGIFYKYTQKPLRVGLLLTGILMIIFRTQPGTENAEAGFAMVTTLLIPVLVIIVIMVMLLDTLMARVMQEETQDIKRYQYAIKLNLLVIFIMCVEWLPYFLVL